MEHSKSTPLSRSSALQYAVLDRLEHSRATEAVGHEPKRTVVGRGKSHQQYNRLGFVPACCYDSMQIEPNEIGGIFVKQKLMSEKLGFFVLQAVCVERIFVK